MNRRLLLQLLGSLWLAGSALAQTAADNTAEIQEIVTVLRQKGPAPVSIGDTTLAKLDFKGLQERFPGLLLMAQPSLPNAQPRSIFTLLLPNQVFYVRVPTFRPAKTWELFDAELRAAISRGALGLVLDVRDFENGADFPGAADCASLFCPSGTVLFTVQGTNTTQRVYTVTRNTNVATGVPLIVLINRRTSGAAEAFAASLRVSARAILIGRSTAGQGAVFVDQRLTTGRYLRYAQEEAVLSDGTKLYAHSVAPDIALYVDDAAEHLAIQKITEGQGAEVIRELPVRRRMNEASLVREDNPEINDTTNAKSDEAKNGGAGVLQDQVLIRACDLLRSLRLFNLTRPPETKPN